MASRPEAYACNTDGDVFRSMDGGRTWTQFQDGSPIDDWYAIDMKPGGAGWVGGGEREQRGYSSLTRYHSECRYMLESVLGYGGQNAIYGISCLSQDEGWAVGKAGLIIHLKPQWPSLPADPTAPVMGAVTADETVSRTATPHARWTASDPESGIKEYQYAVGTSPCDPGSGYVLDWTSTGRYSETAIVGLDLSLGEAYYVYVKAQNHVGVWSSVAVSNTITVNIDATAPVIGPITDDISTAGGATTLHAEWSAEDPESGVVEYQYAIGATPTDPGSGYTKVNCTPSSGHSVSSII
jgi:hypothetical protein